MYAAAAPQRKLAPETLRHAFRLRVPHLDAVAASGMEFKRWEMRVGPELHGAVRGEVAVAARFTAAAAELHGPAGGVDHAAGQVHHGFDVAVHLQPIRSDALGVGH